MLSATTGGVSQSSPTNPDGANKIDGLKTVKVKTEPFSTLSPDVGVGGGGVPVPASALRQNLSNNSANSPPNNAGDHSNTNSNSSNSNNSGSLSQRVNSEGDLHPEDLLKKKKSSAKDEDCALEKVSGNNSSGGVGSSNTKVGAAAAANAVKEEPSDLLGSLGNMKKEDNFSPSMSPVGFGSIGGPSGNIGPDRSVTPVKMELSSNITEKPSSIMGLSSENDIGGCNALVNSLDADRMNDANASNSNITGGPVGGPAGSGPGLGVSLGIGINVSPGASNFMGGNNSVGNALGNCLDYMQQQNHIFVFSTQLANNGAESVLSGQFQTIIAYHCTQPATKSFLEDFFMKNPMKMNKLQRQNSLGLGICNMPGPGGGQSWLNPNANSNNNLNPNPNSNPNLAKILQSQQKPGVAAAAGPKSHFNSQADNSSNKRNAFADPSPADSLVNDSDLMCWETANANQSAVNRNSLDGAQGTAASESHAMKLMEGSVDSVLGKCNSDLSTDNNIISLQGVKVPDENLTPQQRQHREEQLAKLKKMNQFLFPEQDSGPGQLNKLPNDSAMGSIMMSMPGGGATNAQMRQMQLQMQAAQKSQDHMPVQLGEDVLMPLPADVIGEIGAVMSCNSGQKNNLSCGPQTTAPTAAAASGGPVAGGPGGGGGMNVNMNVGMQCSNNPNLMADSPEMMGGFGNTNCVMGIGVGAGAGDKGGIGSQEAMPLPQGGMAPMEWTKIQQQFFEERLKVGKPACRPSGMPGPGTGAGGPGSQQPLIASGSVSSAGSIVNPSNSVMRNNVQGPPPPYHPTQRSASVPIATQSPNPSSPNNLSLPSPRTAGALGLPSNSPNMDLPIPNSSAASVSTTANMGPITTSKNCFQPDAAGSPSSRHRGAGGNPANVLNHHLNSNPSTPLAHLSPKELESFNSTSSGGDLKSTRPSPQRPRTPGNGNANPNSSNHLIEPNNMDSRFPATSPGLNFNAHPQLQNNPNTAMNAYKGPNGNNPLERQNCVSGGQPVQFARRADNMPLNPNSSNRPPPNKMAQNFDPISSLAQMSQQLTSCVSGVGSPAGGMNMMGPGPVDMNMEHGGGMVPGLDATSMDHMSHAAGSNAPNNCHPINPLINSMGQRMLNPKMAGLSPGFSPGPNGVVRDGSGPVGPGSGYHGILPPGARMMGRMPVNFGPNFNPNIQVKASTPNTIQYMPVRPQNNNNNSNNNGNVRMAPSLEFLQRYANPQMANSVGGHTMGNDGGGGPMMIGAGPMNINSPSEQQQQQQNKMGNNHGGNGINMNFFQNCNQLTGLDDEGALGVGMPGHDMSIGQTPMIRGMRPHGMRQHGGLGVRLQAPGGNIVNRHQGQFPGASDGLDCNDPSVMFSNGPGSCNSSPAMFAAAQGQPKGQHIKPLPGNMCQSQVVPNVGMQGPAPVQVQGQGHPGMGGPNNSNLMSSVGNGGGSGGGIGVNFVGPSSNDLKYAQQYHSFQQQLYATNTRSQQQQQQQQGGGNMIAMPSNLSPNPAFFVNK
ncbi:hypothetical protein DVIR88_6g0066 [Drosophila virilis]|uniref:B-cell lymphoma 9 beta-catenin binding domain-containing protein n=1 Tax=Drosophila virilis TaxID=7244 RepID=D0Z7A0_DROVI|nr:hypothetical protein DVIR88_6g0066 [Drosophila virilis]